ncbi:MAG: uracil-DNA glycosylase [Gudongella sp.]|jgi:uracil-DNA glycosylase|nr:uracil-DNA glycosylase [Gudongella sp.]
MKKIFNNSWQELLGPEMEKNYYKELREFLIKEYKSGTIYPDMHSIFNAMHMTDYNDVKVVILGQDPYHGPGQAHGLSFSVKPGVPAPPSLVNIFKELKEDLGYAQPKDGCLEKWAKSGVLLLNTVLTVRRGEANSHRDRGWELFTDQIIRILDAREKPMVFVLWGAPAMKKRSMINTDKHLIISSPHPSPLSAYRGFFGSKPFSRANQFLEVKGLGVVDWSL